MTTLLARRSTRKSARQDVAGWLTVDENYRFLKALARKYRSLALTDAEDVLSEIVVRLLELQADAPADDAAFAAWVDSTAEQVAKTLRGVQQKQVARGTGHDDAVTNPVELVAEEFDGEEPAFEKCEELVRHEQALRRRIQRQLSKLSASQQAAIRAKYFVGVSLNHFAAERGACDSADRMNLLRGKHRLRELLTTTGYAR